MLKRKIKHIYPYARCTFKHQNFRSIRCDRSRIRSEKHNDELRINPRNIKKERDLSLSRHLKRVFRSHDLSQHFTRGILFLTFQTLTHTLYESDFNELQSSVQLVFSSPVLPSQFAKHFKWSASTAGSFAWGAPSAPQPQHFFVPAATTATTSSAQSQHSGSSFGWGWQCGDFSQTRAHFGFWQSRGRWHFQSHNGSSQTDSHVGCGLEHSVWQDGSLQTVSHSGQRPFSQCFTGQRTSHSGLSHLIWLKVQKKREVTHVWIRYYVSVDGQ